MKLRYLSLLLAASTAVAAIDTTLIDPAVKPQDDFYGYANGGWLKKNPIPSDRSRWGSFDELAENNRKILHGILDQAVVAKNPGFIEKLVGDFYASGMDEATVNRLGITPLQVEIDRIEGLAAGDLVAEIGHLHALGVGVAFGLASEQDPKASDRIIAGVGQGGLGLPNKDYYLNDDAASKKLRDQYVAHVAKILELSGETASAAAADSQAVLKLETALAKGSKSDVELRDPVANYHLMAIADIRKLAPDLDWDVYLKNLGLDVQTQMDIGQPEFITAFGAELKATPLAAWKAYFRWHLVHSFASNLSDPFVNEDFAFYGKTLSGTPELRARWKRVLGEIDGSAGEALGQLYVAVAFPPEAKVRARAMVDNLRATLRERITQLTWMDEPTRKAALNKLDHFNVKIGYPDKWIDYSTLVIDRGPYVLNVARANVFNVKRDLAKIGKPTDRTVWGMTPPTVNAYYDPTLNEIVFPAGILQPPFFDQKADDAANYGGIGAVIGHEMTHGFDDQGRQFDEKGNLTDWWSPASTDKFKARAAGIVAQFNGYVPLENLHVNGQLTQGENIADLGGVTIAYVAFMKTDEGRSKALIDGFTPQQRFFLGWATIWRENIRPEMTKLYLNTDPHSPDQFRVNGPLSNLAEFVDAFKVPEGAPMRRPDKDRVTIW